MRNYKFINEWLEKRNIRLAAGFAETLRQYAKEYKKMLKLYIGCSDADRRADAINCLNGLYGDVGQNKYAAMSYIEESLNISDPYFCY